VNETEPYISPTIEELGSLRELTLTLGSYDYNGDHDYDHED
jgi:hypothetical protein